MKRPKFLYYENLKYEPEVIRRIKEHFEFITLFDPSHDRDDILHGIDICLAPLGFSFDKNKIDCCPQLKIIGSSTLSIPHIDIEYALSKGIKVCYLNGSQKEFLKTITPTAELAWGLVIAITRLIPWAYKDVLKGKWGGKAFGHKTPRMLSAMSLGVVGLGRLGSLVASYGKAFGMKVYYCSPNSVNSDYERCETLIELAKKSDIVSLHAHYTPETEGLVNKEFFEAMKQGSFIVNTARGKLIDEKALLEALESGALGGAALDVLADEYEPDFELKLTENPLLRYANSHDNLILTPHCGGATVDARVETQARTIELIIESVNCLRRKD